MERTEIRIAGTGGQGVVLAGILLADAAVRDGKKVVQTQSYGPERVVVPAGRKSLSPTRRFTTRRFWSPTSCSV